MKIIPPHDPIIYPHPTGPMTGIPYFDGVLVYVGMLGGHHSNAFQIDSDARRNGLDTWKYLVGKDRGPMSFRNNFFRAVNFEEILTFCQQRNRKETYQSLARLVECAFARSTTKTISRQTRLTKGEVTWYLPPIA